MNHKELQSKEGRPKKSFETRYDPIHQCILLKILDVEGMSPFFLLEHPKAGTYRVNMNKNGLHVTR